MFSLINQFLDSAMWALRDIQSHAWAGMWHPSVTFSVNAEHINCLISFSKGALCYFFFCILLTIRHGHEDKLVTIMGVMQALVSFVQDSKDSLRSIVAGKHKFVFLVRDHLILVGVTRGTDSTQQMLLQLMYVYNQVGIPGQNRKAGLYTSYSTYNVCIHYISVFTHTKQSVHL